MNACLDDNLRCVEQALALLHRLSDDLYAAPGGGGADCALGPQFRHILDHYGCLLRGARSGCIDYDARARDATLEVDRGAAIAAFERLVRELPTLADVGPALRVRIHAGARAETDVGAHPSSLPRELHFLLLHTIHHFAVIATALRARGLETEPGFGVAPSTLGWRRAGASR